MEIQPYLFFNGRCEEAADFYHRAVGAEVEFAMKFKESPDKGSIPPGAENKIMHMSLKIGSSTVLLSDGRCQGQASFEGFSLSVVVETDAEASRLFSALGQGGKVQMPLTKTFFSSNFGMLEDKFGVSWMIYVKQ